MSLRTLALAALLLGSAHSQTPPAAPVGRGPVRRPSGLPVGRGLRPPPVPACRSEGPHAATRPAAEVAFGPAFLALTEPRPGTEWLEGQRVPVRWRATAGIRVVQVRYEAPRCPLGGQPRGAATGWVCRGTPADLAATLEVPVLDGLSVRLTASGLDAEGREVAHAERTVAVRPRELGGLPPTALVVLRARQRLYYQRDGRLLRMCLISTGTRGQETPAMRPDQRLARHGRAGLVLAKSRYAYSRLYNLPTPYWMAITSSGRLGLHATSPSYYDRLGTAASHGCIRLHDADARALFAEVALGTPVFIF